MLTVKTIWSILSLDMQGVIKGSLKGWGSLRGEVGARVTVADFLGAGFIEGAWTSTGCSGGIIGWIKG